MDTPMPADNQTSMNSLSALAGLSMKDLMAKSDVVLPKVGDVVEGVIINISKNAVMVDLGALGTGVVYPGEFYDNTTLQKSLAVGQTVTAILLGIEDEEGLGFRELSLKRAQRTTAWEDIKEKKDKGEVLMVKIANINKGGLIVELNGVQGFLPLSQLSPEHYPKVEGGDTTKIVQALQKFRGTEFKIKIIDFSEEENRLIVSEKAVNEAQLQEELSKFKVSETVTGTVTDVTDFGAFVLIHQPTDTSSEKTETVVEGGEIAATPAPMRRGIEGLIHISEIDWKIIDNPRDVLARNQEITAKIISVENGKISLSLKALKTDPWEKAHEKYTVGQKHTGKVVKITNYGALVSLDDEITGLVPLSEFDNRKPSDVFAIGDTPEVAIVSLDPKEHKMLLTVQKPGASEPTPAITQ